MQNETRKPFDIIYYVCVPSLSSGSAVNKIALH